VETHFLWCGNALCQQRDSNDVVSRRYYSEGELGPSGGLYYGQDQLGSIRDLTAVADGSPAASYDYDPYGNPSQTAEQASADFRYAEMFYERGSGLYLTRYRAYDPGTGRWLSRDPLGPLGGVNLYSYAAPNPISYSDPSGRTGSPSEYLKDFASGQLEQWMEQTLEQNGVPKDEASFVAAGFLGTAEAVWETRGWIILECPECLIPIFLLQGYRSRVEDAGMSLAADVLAAAWQNFSGQSCSYIPPASIVSPWFLHPTVQNDTVPQDYPLDDATLSLIDSLAPDNVTVSPDRFPLRPTLRRTQLSWSAK
jgi:RHS repeat-associated protein